MSTAFDWSQYEKSAQPKQESSAPETFDWSQYEKSKEKKESSSAASIVGREYTAGALGTVGDIVNLYDSLTNNPAIRAYNKFAAVPIPQVPEMFRGAGTEAVSKGIQEISGGRSPEDIYERYAETVGRFSGQEAALGGAIGGAGGPGVAATTALIGTLHGAVSGAVFQTARELGMSDEGAAIVTTFFTLSPVAAKKAFPAIWNKIKNIKTGKRIEKGIIGENLPVSAYETAEKALGEAQKGPFEQIPGEKAPFQAEISPQVAEEGKSLKGRVSKGATEKGQSSFQAEIGPQKIEGAKSLEGRVTSDSHSPLSPISKNRFQNDTAGGSVLSKMVKQEAADQRKFVTEAYNKAEKAYETVNGVFPELSKKLDDLIVQMEKSAKPNSGEKAVIDNAKAVLDIIGSGGELIEQPVSRLIKTSDSISGIANYDMPYTGPRNILKKMVKDINEEVIKEIKRNGVDPSLLKDADRIYGEWANKFANDEITPFLKKDNLNPESIYRTATKHEGTYRALQQALGNTKEGKKWLPMYERDYVNERLEPYIKKLDKVGSNEYKQEIKNLQGTIGSQKAAQIDKNLRKEAKIRPIPPKEVAKIAPERITSATQTKPFQVRESAKKRIHDTLQENYYLDKKQETNFTNHLDKIAKYSKVNPEDLIKKLDSRSGIKELRKDLKTSDFDILTRQKMRSMLREGNIEHKFTGDKLYQVLNKEKNFEIFNELLGVKTAEAARLAAKEVGKRQLTQDAVVGLVKKKLLVDYLGRDVIRVLKQIENLP